MGRYLKSFIVQTGKDIFIRFPKKIWMFGTFIKEFNQFKSTNDSRFSFTTADIYPCLKDKVSTTPFDHHYIYHPAWAALILTKKPKEHIDFCSILSFRSIISAFVPITFYGCRCF